MFEAAQHFFGGGTDFEAPLDCAVDLMKEQGWNKADLVFINDSECRVSEEFAEWFAMSKAGLGFTVAGVLMDQDSCGWHSASHPSATKSSKSARLAASVPLTCWWETERNAHENGCRNVNTGCSHIISLRIKGQAQNEKKSSE